MTFDQRVSEKKSITLEINARRELLRRLAFPMKQLKNMEEKDKIQRELRVAQNRTYQTVNEAQDAYGWDLITEDEYRDIVTALETGEDYIVNAVTSTSAALQMLSEFIGRISSDIRSLEFELLPPEEQIKRMEAADKRREEMLARREERGLSS